MSGTLRKAFSKLSYLAFIVLLDLSFLYIRVLGLVHFLFPRSSRQKDLILFPYAFTGSDGYIRRFEEYFPYLDKAGISYRVCRLFSDDYARKCLAGSDSRRYFFYLQVLWKRIPQVLAARAYRAAFIQRGLFPLYFDLEFPHLERLLRKLNQHVTIDFWDSVFERQGILVNSTIRYADQLSLSNEFLYAHFHEFPGKRVLWKIAVNLGKYKLKTDYKIRGKARIFWTGLPHNLAFLEKYLPVLAHLSETYPLLLVLVGQKSIHYQGLEVEHHPWDPATFFSLLQLADIGIYPEFNSVVSKGKSAMKVMDYLSTGLPMVGVPYGLPTEARNGRDLLIASDYNDWGKQLTRLLKDEALRATLGRNGRALVEKNYSLDPSYEVFRSFVFAKSK